VTLPPVPGFWGWFQLLHSALSSSSMKKKIAESHQLSEIHTCSTRKKVWSKFIYGCIGLHIKHASLREDMWFWNSTSQDFLRRKTVEANNNQQFGKQIFSKIIKVQQFNQHISDLTIPIYDIYQKYSYLTNVGISCPLVWLWWVGSKPIFGYIWAIYLALEIRIYLQAV